MGAWTPQGVLMWPFAVKRTRKEQSQPAPCPAVSTAASLRQSIRSPHGKSMLQSAQEERVLIDHYRSIGDKLLRTPSKKSFWARRCVRRLPLQSGSLRRDDYDYRQRLETPEIKERIRRNLEKIKALGSILDFNLRAFEKGGSEPYVSKSILKMALDLGVPCVPGDDSHGVAGVGLHLEKGTEILKQTGFSTDWQFPRGCGTSMKLGGTRELSPTIRSATPADAETIVRIYIDSWNAGFGSLLSQADRTVTPALTERWHYALAQPVPHRWWVAEHMGSIVGFVGIGPSRDPVDARLGELDTIAVDPSHWRTGVGKALMSVALRHLVEDGYDEAIVWTVEGYERGIAFYEATGWSRDGGVRDEGRQIRFRRDLATL